jgi:low affinity Fe/Cu permease
MPRKRRHLFGNLANGVTRAAGSSSGFMAAFGLVALWAATGPLFDFSTSWQMIINTATTIITFLMVFVIQHSQNRDTLAIQLKLNELISTNASANNKLVDIEELSPEELAVVKKFYVKLAARSETAANVRSAHSLDEAGSSLTVGSVK